MCRLCLPRRAVLAASAILPLASARAATSVTVPIEPRMRLAAPPLGQFEVALTLDACPGDFDERLALALIESRIAATIFVTELWLLRNLAGLDLLLAHRDLFGIANHGELHVPPVIGRRRIYGVPTAGGIAAVRREVERGAAAVATATGVRPRWYRAATGYYSPSVLPEIRRLGQDIAGYSLNADAGASLPAAAVAARIGRAANGEIVIAHINQPQRPSGLGVIAGVRDLQRRGASFRRLDQLAPANVDYA